MSLINELFEKYAPLNNFDMGVYTMFTATVAARFIYYLSQVFSPLISKTYVGMTAAHQADWNSRTVSTINAIIITYLSYYILFVDPNSSVGLYKDPVYYTSRLGLFTLAILGGYLINDTWVVWEHRHGIHAVTSTIVHHILAITGIILVWNKNVTFFYPLAYAFTEASTPFVNLRWWLYSVHLKHTKRYLLTGLCMTISFFVIRILFVPYIVFHSYYRVTWEVLQTLPWPEFIVALFYPTAGNLLNGFWFILIAKGLLRALFPVSENKQAKPKQT